MKPSCQRMVARLLGTDERERGGWWYRRAATLVPATAMAVNKPTAYQLERKWRPGRSRANTNAIRAPSAYWASARRCGYAFFGAHEKRATGATFVAARPAGHADDGIRCPDAGGLGELKIQKTVGAALCLASGTNVVLWCVTLPDGSFAQMT